MRVFHIKSELAAAENFTRMRIHLNMLMVMMVCRVTIIIRFIFNWTRHESKKFMFYLPHQQQFFTSKRLQSELTNGINLHTDEITQHVRKKSFHQIKTASLMKIISLITFDLMWASFWSSNFLMRTHLSSWMFIKYCFFLLFKFKQQQQKCQWT